ncbi:hypothetical protein GN316_13700 [Xylophilus sp. Kf1]|nr:hypothetical protein [Xylophilus sp. Kf1]
MPSSPRHHTPCPIASSVPHSPTAGRGPVYGTVCRAVLLGSLLSWLGGCATPPPPPAPPPPPPVVCETPVLETVPTPIGAPVASSSGSSSPRAVVQAQVEGNVALLGYADRVRVMSLGELGAELARLNDMPEASRGAYAELQLAIVLGQTRQPQDMQRAIGLLQRLANAAGEDARRLQPMGRLLAARYAEQRRVEDLLDRQNATVRDMQRRMDQLNERLEAVRAIERSLTRSNGGGATAPAGGVRP